MKASYKGGKMVDCRKCKWHEPIPGNVHIRCRHPKADFGDDPLVSLFSILGGLAPFRTKLKIKLHPQA